MNVYIKKDYGLANPAGPLAFGMRGSRTAALNVLQTGDLVVLVGTLNDKTAEGDRGRAVGIVEPTRVPIQTMDFAIKSNAMDFDAKGNYRWPWGLHISNAWELPDRPELSEISDRRFYMDAAAGIVKLTDQEAQKILSYRRETVPLLKPTAQARARIDPSASNKRFVAPIPTTTRRGTMHMRRSAAFTYVLEIVGADAPAFKIGWAFDYLSRSSQFNQAAMPELGGLKYRPVLHHLWDTARIAYRVEQKLLLLLSNFRHPANHEIVHGIPLKHLESVWVRAVAHT